MPFLYMGAFTFVSKFAPATQSGNSFHRAHINFTFFSCLCFRRYLCFFIFIFLFNKTKSQIKQQQAFSTNMQDTLRWGLARSVHNENGGKIREFRNERESGPSLLPQRFLGLLLATRERILGSLRFNDATATRTCKKKKKTGLIRFFVHFFTVFARVRRASFMENVNKQRRNFISLSELENGPLEFKFRRVRVHLTKQVRISAIKTEKTQIHFLGDVVVAIASLDF